MEGNENTGGAPGGGQESNRRLLRAIVVKPMLKEGLAGHTKEVPESDLLRQISADGRLIEPPFQKIVLAMLPEHSTSLGSVIDAMVQNIDGFGYRLEPRVKTDQDQVPKDIAAEIAEERSNIVNFLNNCCVDYSFTELRRRTRKDIEITGEGFWEVIRAPSSGQVVQLNHIPSHQIWLGMQDKQLSLYERKVPFLRPDGSVVLDKQRVYKRFRRFVQARFFGMSAGGAGGAGYQAIWFKEFGDKRVISNLTGDVVPDDKLDNTPEHERANEIIHWKIYSPRTPYGLPRYIGCLITLFGDRASDEINYVTLRNNNIPSMVILCSNGQLTEGTVKRIQDFVDTQIQGNDNYSKFLIIEGEGQIEGDDAGHMKLEIKQLSSEQIKDQLFQEYSKNNRDKVRETFRLPPVFVGRCHSSDTEYLTNNGWKTYHEVSEQDLLGTYNMNTGKLEYQLPTERHCYVHNDDMVRIDTKFVGALVTKNHRMLVRTHDKWWFCQAKRLLEARKEQVEVLVGTSDKATEMIGKIGDVRLEPYSGQVTCFTVPNGTLVTRYSGKMLVSGNSEEMTGKAGESMRRLADEQVFKPERDSFDEQMNTKLMPELGVVYHSFKSNGPNVTDDEDLIKILESAERTGGLTPRIARMILAEIFGRDDLPALDSSVKLDIPFSLQLAEALKNKGAIESQMGPVENEATEKSLGGQAAERLVSSIIKLRGMLESELVNHFGTSEPHKASGA